MNKIKYIIALLVLPAILVLTGCSAPSSPEPTDLTGDWSYSKDLTGFEATVEDGVLEVYLSLDGTEGLYWSGTFQDEAVDGQEIFSDADVDALAASLYGSQSETKTFVFKDGEIHFEFIILGTTTDIALTR